jgi:ferredoxin-NADP reductase
MSIHNIKLISKHKVAEGTMGFDFEKSADVEYIAGQFADFTIIDPPENDEESATREFSLVHAPYEGEIVFVTRMRDTAFKRIMKDMPIGTEVKLDGPYGDFNLHKTLTTPAVFLSGGIGVTPVRSIIAQATHDKLDQQITLFSSNRTQESAAFTDSFNTYAAENDKFTFVPVITQTPPEGWTSETGYVTAEMLHKYIPDMTALIYYLSGPAEMVAAIRKILVEDQVNEDNICTEEFSGY